MSSRAETLRKVLSNDQRDVSVDIDCLVYNHGKYLSQALDGMLMQNTNFPFRIIIHDDSSTDNSADIIREYQARYPDIIIAVIEEENQYKQGKSVYKKMLPYYTAKYIATCEGDDFWIDKNKLQKQIDYLETHRECSACYHNILPVDEFGQYDESLRGCYPKLKDGNYSEKEIRFTSVKTQTASLVRRNLKPFLSEEDIVAYVNAKSNGDEKMLLIFGLMGRVHYMSDVMAAHRRVFWGDSYTAKLNGLSEIDKIIVRYDRRVANCQLYKYYTGKTLYLYNELLIEIFFGVVSRRLTIKGGDLRKIAERIHIPFYAFLIYLFSFPIKCILTIFCRMKNFICK